MSPPSSLEFCNPPDRRRAHPITPATKGSRLSQLTVVGSPEGQHARLPCQGPTYLVACVFADAPRNTVAAKRLAIAAVILAAVALALLMWVDPWGWEERIFDLRDQVNP